MRFVQMFLPAFLENRTSSKNMWTNANEGCKNNGGALNESRSPHLPGYNPNLRVAVNEQASTTAGCRYLRRTRELRSSRRWTMGFLLLLPLTAVISIQFVSAAKAAVLGGPFLSAESFGAIELSSCKLSGVPQPARCGVLEVPENPNRPAGRQLKIGVAVIPATGGKSRPDPIVILMGGPGEDAISAAEIYVKQFTALRQDRDILLVDQRGTGRSGALNCALFSAQEAAVSLRDVFPAAAVEKCEQSLRARADLTQYTYDRFASDLEQVRHALGYGPLNLFGGSYGTRAAQVYLRMYPKSVRTVYMGSVVPLDAATPLPFAKTGQTALEKMFDACAGDPACNAAFPNLREEFRQISARLSSGSVRVTVQGQTGTVPLDRGRVAEWFRSKLYRPRSSTALPWMIHRAFHEDWTPISKGVLADASDDSPFSFGLFFSLRLRAVRMSGLSEKPTSKLKPRALSWVTIACVSNRLPASFGLRPHSRKTIANLFSHPCRPCSPLVIPMALRRYGTRSMSPRVSRIALKSCSVGRGTPSGMNASRRFIKRSSFPARWAAGAHRPARWCHDRHSDYSRFRPDGSQVHGRVRNCGWIRK